MYKNFILHVSLIEGIGPLIIQKIVEHATREHDYMQYYSYCVNDWMHKVGITPGAAQKLVDGLSNETLLAMELNLIEKNNVQWAVLDDPHYPHLLRYIHLPPPIIYWQGVAHAHNEQSIAIVGSRKANNYAHHFISQAVPLFVEHGWSVVSGGALGADTMAHQSTVNSGGRTIAVLGSGLLRPYPAQNRKLFASIKDKGGMIISTFPLLMQALPGNFPARNRVISGMSRGCIVVQAAKQSGASITAHYALEQGREVFAVPGCLNDPLSEGCHALIQQGAKLVTSGRDVLEEFDVVVEPYVTKNLPVESLPVQLSISTSLVERIQKTTYNDQQKNVLIACLEPSTLDQLIEKTNWPMGDLQGIMLDLQMESRLVQDMAGRWKTTF